MSSPRAAHTQGHRTPLQAFPYCIGAGLGLHVVFRLLHLLPGSLAHLWTAAGMAGLVGSTTGGALVGYGLWWMAVRRSPPTLHAHASRFVVYCRQCRRAIEFPQAMRGSKKKCPSCGTRQRMPRHLDPSVIPLGKDGEDLRRLPQDSRSMLP